MESKSILGIATILLTFMLLACDNNDSNNSTTDDDSLPVIDSSLSELQVTGVELDQVFQSSLTEYTANVGYLVESIVVTPTLVDLAASITVNGEMVVSGSPSSIIKLDEGVNNIEAVVSAGDSLNTYTITITRASADTFAERAYLKALNAGSDAFGSSVSLDGDILAVGARDEPGDADSTMASPNDNAGYRAGAVYLFARNNDGTWTQTHYLKASNAQGGVPSGGDYFGESVALQGDTLLVGAPTEDGDTNSTPDAPNENLYTSGAVYVFNRDEFGDWNEMGYLKASNAGAGDVLGWNLSLDGDRFAVNAFREDGDANSTIESTNDNVDGAGAVYVFKRNESNQWKQEAYIKASNAGHDDFFGNSISLQGDRLAIGAGGESGDASSTIETPNDNAPLAGAVYIFERNESNEWLQQAYLKASNVESGDNFGSSVSLDDNLLAVGALREDGDSSSTLTSSNNNEQNAGAAYIFSRNNDNQWVELAYLKASNAEADEFGYSVLLKGERLFVGATREDGDANSTMESPNNFVNKDAGAVYVFAPNNSNQWVQVDYLKAFNAGGNSGGGYNFGNALDAEGDTLVIGSRREFGDADSTIDSPNTNTIGAGAVYTWQ